MPLQEMGMCPHLKKQNKGWQQLQLQSCLQRPRCAGTPAAARHGGGLHSCSRSEEGLGCLVKQVAPGFVSGAACVVDLVVLLTLLQVSVGVITVGMLGESVSKFGHQMFSYSRICLTVDAVFCLRHQRSTQDADAALLYWWWWLGLFECL